ncbi:MAG: hypothetical protein ABSH06_23760 [Thermodesulfobacteriota bacterium]|jgi:hypothetical protein
MSKFLANEKESEELFKQLEEIKAEEAEVKVQQKLLEPSMRRCFQRFVLENACLNSEEAGKARIEGEGLRAKKVALWDCWYRKLTKIQIDLQRITLPVIIDFSESLMKELRSLNNAKVFKVLVDKEDLNKEHGRIFKAEHNFFSVHACQQEILKAVEQIKEMDLQPLSSIKEKFDEAITKIPEEFEMVVTKGNSTFRTWIFDNRGSDGSSANPEVTWLHVAMAKSDLAMKEGVMNFWNPVRTPNPDREVSKIVNKHIIGVELGDLMDSRK